MLLHVVARARFGARPLKDPEPAWRLWRGLRRAFPNALAACVMPSHLHVVTPGEPAAARARLRHVLSEFARSRGTRALAGVWEPVPEAVVVADTKHLLRQIRYVHLNPCRDGLVADPLAWPYSTHRGVLGAHYEPWIDATALARQVGMPSVGFDEWFQGYVSGDPSVEIAGTPPPRPAPPTAIPVFPLGDIMTAVLAAAPMASLPALRRGIVLLAQAQGWRDSPLLARALDVSPQWVRRLRDHVDDPLLRAGATCLGDPRCRWGARDWRRVFPAGVS